MILAVRSVNLHNQLDHDVVDPIGAAVHLHEPISHADLLRTDVHIFGSRHNHQ